MPPGGRRAGRGTLQACARGWQLHAVIQIAWDTQVGVGTIHSVHLLEATMHSSRRLLSWRHAVFTPADNYGFTDATPPESDASRVSALPFQQARKLFMVPALRPCERSGPRGIIRELPL